MARASAIRPHALIPAITIAWHRVRAALLLAWLVVAVMVNRGGTSVLDHRTPHLVMAAMLLAYAASLVLERRLPGPTALDTPIATLLCVGALAVALSPYRSFSFEASLDIAAMVIVFYALAGTEILSVDATVRTLVFIIALLAAMGVLAFALQYATGLALKQAVLGTLSAGDYLPKWFRPSVFYHPNMLAAAMNLGLPFALALLLHARSRDERIFSAAAAVLCALTLLLTNSRGGWLACVAATATFAGLQVASHDASSLRRVTALLARHRRAAIAALLACALGAGIVALALLATQPPWLFRHTAGSRFALIRGALHLIEKRPVLGYGPYTSFGLLFPSYNLHHSHNLYLDLLVGAGVLGLFAAILFAWAAARVLRSALRQRDPRRAALAAASVAALVSILVHGLVDVPLHYPGFVLLVAVVLAIAVRLAGMRAHGAFGSTLARGAVVAILPLCLGAWWLSDSAQSHYAQSLASLDEGRLHDAVSEAELASNAEPGSIAYAQTAGILQALAYQASLNGGTPDSSALSKAIEHLDHAASLDDQGGVVFANLAEAEQLAGDKGAAAAAARRALALTPPNQFMELLKDPSIILLSGSVLEWGGFPDEAVNAFADALRIDPNVVASPFWDASPDRVELRQQAVELAGVSPCLLGRAITLFSASRARLEDFAAQCQSQDRDAEDEAALAIILEGQGRHEAALVQASLASSRSHSPAAHTALGYVLAGDDLQQARRDLLTGDKDGLLLLACTYDACADAAPGLSSLQSDGPVPAPLIDELENAVLFQPARIASSFYTAQLRRSAPPTPLIPGDWLDLVSPRLRLEQAIVDEHR